MITCKLVMHAQRQFIHFISVFCCFYTIGLLVKKLHSAVAVGFRDIFEAHRYWALVEQQQFTCVQEGKV